MDTFYIAMAGLHGCIPQYCDIYDSLEDATEGLQLIHEFGKRKLRELKRDQYIELNLHYHGNEYAEIATLDRQEALKLGWKHEIEELEALTNGL